MSGKSIKDILKEFGLADNQAKIYIYLAKHGVAKGGDIAKQTKMQKATVYRTLKILQRKGFVETTLEFPARYTAVPFETVLDHNIKEKKEEALRIERSKNDLLEDWKKIGKVKQDQSIEKFTVIEGDRKIFAKIFQMIKQTKNELIAASTVSDLFRADRYGVYDAVYDHPLKTSVKFRFLTDLEDSDLNTAKLIKNRLRSDLDFRGRNPELGIALFPRMVIRDQKEILLFISDKENKKSKISKQTCLCTNCKSIIQSFSSVFEDLWKNSTNIKQKIKEIETGKPSPKTQIIKDPKSAKHKYHEILNSAEKEILIITSSNGLNNLSKNIEKLENWNKKNVSIKVMAPVINENLKEVQKLLRWGEVKHIPLGYFETSIIDGIHLFQFKNSSQKLNLVFEKTNFKNTFYTNDKEYIQRTKKLISNIWKKTHVPLTENVHKIAQSLFIPSTSSVDSHRLEKKTQYMRNLEYKKIEKINEEYILEKINHEKKHSSKNFLGWSSTKKYFGNKAFAAIHPPKSFGLPNMVIGFWHNDKDSSIGVENWILVNLWQKTKKDFDYIPVAFVQDTPQLIGFRKKIFAGFPVENNINIFKKGEIQIHLKGRSLFAAWTKPIPLGSSNLTLPPSSVLFEGYGDVKSGALSNVSLSGRKQEFWYNCLDAFVTFFHPKSKYVGSGIEGFIEIDRMFISSPSNKK